MRAVLWALATSLEAVLVRSCVLLKMLVICGFLEFRISSLTTFLISSFTAARWLSFCSFIICYFFCKVSIITHNSQKMIALHWNTKNWEDQKHLFYSFYHVRFAFLNKVKKIKKTYRLVNIVDTIINWDPLFTTLPVKPKMTTSRKRLHTLSRYMWQLIFTTHGVKSYLLFIGPFLLAVFKIRAITG